MNDEQDARRYRWIASNGGCPFSEADPVWESVEALSAAIDCEMTAQERARESKVDASRGSDG